MGPHLTIAGRSGLGLPEVRGSEPACGWGLALCHLKANPSISPPSSRSFCLTFPFLSCLWPSRSVLHHVTLSAPGGGLDETGILGISAQEELQK